MKLEPGQVAVVTGAASGIGLALAHRLAGVRTLAVRVDVSRSGEVDELARRSIEEFGSVNVVCNNAGVASRADPWTGPLDAWNWVIGVNLLGVVHGVRAFLPHLVAAGKGHIVNTASVAGLAPGMGPS